MGVSRGVFSWQFQDCLVPALWTWSAVEQNGIFARTAVRLAVRYSYQAQRETHMTICLSLSLCLRSKNKNEQRRFWGDDTHTGTDKIWFDPTEEILTPLLLTQVRAVWCQRSCCRTSPEVHCRCVCVSSVVPFSPVLFATNRWLSLFSRRWPRGACFFFRRQSVSHLLNDLNVVSPMRRE